MSTATTAPALPANYEYSVKTVERFVRKVDTWRTICAEAKAGDLTRYNPNTRMPSKQMKGWAYDEAWKITTALGLPRCSTVEDLRAAAAAGRAALGSVPSPISKAAGTAWACRARAAGFTIRTSQSGVVVELTRSITPGDAGAYMAAESAALNLLAEVPRTSPGTTWGSTSDGVGGHAGLTSGYLYFAVSGASKRFVSGV